MVEEDVPQAQRITLVMDNLSPHTGASLYKTFEPAKARLAGQAGARVCAEPNHGSWLNITACEFSVLARQCLDRRMPDIDSLRTEVDAWTEARNPVSGPVQWHFTTNDARIKLCHLTRLLEIEGLLSVARTPWSHPLNEMAVARATADRDRGGAVPGAGGIRTG